MSGKVTTSKNQAHSEQEDRETRFIRFMFGEKAIRKSKERFHKADSTNEKFDGKRTPIQSQSGGDGQKEDERIEFFRQLNQMIQSAARLRSMAKKVLK